MVFKKKYNIYKILISYIFLQAIIECFCGICTSLHEEDHDDLILKVSGWVGNYELINNGYKLFQKFNIMLSVLDICIDKNTFEKSILYISEILCLPFPRRINSDSKNDAPAKHQQVPVLSCDLTSVHSTFFTILKPYPFAGFSSFFAFSCAVSSINRL